MPALHHAAHVHFLVTGRDGEQARGLRAFLNILSSPPPPLSSHFSGNARLVSIQNAPVSPAAEVPSYFTGGPAIYRLMSDLAATAAGLLRHLPPAAACVLDVIGAKQPEPTLHALSLRDLTCTFSAGPCIAPRIHNVKSPNVLVPKAAFHAAFESASCPWLRKSWWSVGFFARDSRSQPKSPTARKVLRTKTLTRSQSAREQRFRIKLPP